MAGNWDLHGVGGDGEFACATIRSPFEVVKQNMQMQYYRRVRDAIKNIFKIRGWSGFYAGYSPLLLREIPFSAIQLPLYEWFNTFR